MGASLVALEVFMRFSTGALVTFVSYAVILVGLAVGHAVVGADRAVAQTLPGEYSLYQPGSSDPVGWVRVNGDRSVEWWAYVGESYAWADSTNTPASPWHLEARYVGSGAWPTYAIWKADVLQRAVAQGRTIVFQDHSVAEESVEN
jgi:hypothetical protein